MFFYYKIAISGTFFPSSFHIDLFIHWRSDTEKEAKSLWVSFEGVNCLAPGKLEQSFYLITNSVCYFELNTLALKSNFYHGIHWKHEQVAYCMINHYTLEIAP